MSTDNKIGLTLAKKCQDALITLTVGNTEIQAVKDAYITANPNVNVQGFPFTPQEVTDVNTMLNAVDDLINNTYAATIAMVMSKSIGSHKGNALG